MNMQQLLAQAQKAQRELAKAQQALAEKEFEASANGGVTIKMSGKREILNLDIDPDLLDPSSKDRRRSSRGACLFKPLRAYMEIQPRA